jgi:hypothetical protein
MKNALFGLLGTLAVSALMIFSANAGSLSGFDPKLSKAYSKSDKIVSLMSLKLPRYEQWKQLPPEAQRRVIQNIQEFLVQIDTEVRGGTDESALNDVRVLERLFDLWLETAEAKPRTHSRAEQQPFCINQGVVRPLSDCKTELGSKMHDFDTNEVLSKLGPASNCPSGLMPCSPFFGFNPDGQMFCSSKNLTRDCAQQSKQPGTLSLANVMLSCEQGSPGAAKVDCTALGKFYDEQIKAVESLCKKSPKRFACGILKDQMRNVRTDVSKTKEAAEKVGLDKIADAVKATNEAAQMSVSSAPCQTDETAKAKKASAPASPAVAQPAASPQKSSCTQKVLSKMPEKPTFEVFRDELMGQKPDEFICGELTLPNQAKLAIDLNKGIFAVQASPQSKPIALNLVEAQVFDTISAGLLEDPFKVPAKDLFSRYFPKEALKDSGKITLESQDGKEKRDFPTKGWVTPDGTRIRYIPSLNFGSEEKPKVIASIQIPGGEEQKISVDVILPESQKEKPAGPPARSKEARAAAPQRK